MFIIIDLKIHLKIELFGSSNRFKKKYKNDNNAENTILKKYTFNNEIENHVLN